MALRVFVVVALLAMSAWLQARWTGRLGGASPDVAAAATALARVPLTIGDWDGRDFTADESEVVYAGKVPQLVRRYVHRATGETVCLYLTCGGPRSMMFEHTPLTCYGALGYAEVGAGGRVAVAAEADKPGGEFFVHTFVKATPVATSRVRLFWGWGDDRTWSFPDEPRIQFAGKSVLYKVYFTREMASEDQPVNNDPAIAFIKAILAELPTTAGRPPPE